MKPGLAVLLEPVDPLTLVPRRSIRGDSGGPKTFSEIGYGVIILPVVVEASVTPLKGIGHHLLTEESITHVLRICVTYVLRIFRNLCPGTVQLSPRASPQTAHHSATSRSPTDLLRELRASHQP